MKRKLKKKVSIVLVLIIAILLIIAIIGIYNKINSPNEDSQNNIGKNVSHEDNNNQVIPVVIDKKEEQNNEGNTTTSNNENNNDPKEGNVNNNGEGTKPNTTSKDNNTKDKSTYYIKINNQANVVTIYKKDSSGKYTIPVKAMLCSIGEATPTSGVYKTSDMYKWRLLQGNVYGQYAVRITGHILFHSVPYTKQSKDALEWWEYDKLGTDASLGCIRLTVEDAKWIYDNCEKGTQVEFYYSSNPGPLGKPTAKKISSYSEELKNWDPTDPDKNNPWKTYVETSNPPEESTVETGTSQVEPIDT